MTTATSTYTVTTTGGSVIIGTAYRVQVTEQSSTVSSATASATANSNEGAAGVAVAFGSLVIALLAAIFVL
jgi:hypothetical protein